jgi:hypothetical protein
MARGVGFEPLSYGRGFQRKLEKLLRYRLSIEDMKLILEPCAICLFDTRLTLARKPSNTMSIFIPYNSNSSRTS